MRLHILLALAMLLLANGCSRGTPQPGETSDASGFWVDLGEGGRYSIVKVVYKKGNVTTHSPLLIAKAPCDGVAISRLADKSFRVVDSKHPLEPRAGTVAADEVVYYDRETGTLRILATHWEDEVFDDEGRTADFIRSHLKGQN